MEYIKPTPIIDCDNSSVIDFAKKTCSGIKDPSDQAVGLYYAVRDGFRYDPYKLDLSAEGLKASTTLQAGRGWCVSKAILLTACCRAINIPARLGFADVRNHLSTKRMREMMKTDIFYWHGYSSIYLDGKWVKATPAFNIELCERFSLVPLDFDGKDDSIYQAFDLKGNRHMEYISYRGEFADVPIDAIMETFLTKYTAPVTLEDADFDSEVEQET